MVLTKHFLWPTNESYIKVHTIFRIKLSQAIRRQNIHRNSLKRFISEIREQNSLPKIFNKTIVSSPLTTNGANSAIPESDRGSQHWQLTLFTVLRQNTTTGLALVPFPKWDRKLPPLLPALLHWSPMDDTWHRDTRVRF